MSDLLEMFGQYRKSKIAIYGLGTETERVLSQIDQEFQIIGLLDSYKEDGMLYGKPIISFKEAVEKGVKLIIVVARPGSCKAIAKRISNACKENQIDLIDIRGKDLCDLKKVTYDFKSVNGITKEHLTRLVNENEVISIDLFDTLVMRQTLFPTDIFEMIDCRLRERGIAIDDFGRKRLESEKYLSKFTAPTLVEIYSYMRDTYSMSEITPDELAQIEWSIDYNLVIPRQEMCDFMSEICNQGKEIYIVSDTYYTQEQLEKLLNKCGITFYTDIFASCEYKTGKTGRLFEIVKDRISGESCLHIGDDTVTDIESAEKHGISSCHIYSGIELLEQAGYLRLWDNIEQLADRIKVGMFVSKLFNSPFQFETKERRISVKNAYDIGYIFFAPMISDFVIWFEEQVKQYDLQNIWFCARDGYLIKKLYDQLTGDTSSLYFLTSRTAAIRAGVENEQDIEYVREMKFSGTLTEQLWERFGISDSCEINCNAVSREKVTLLDYSDEILKKACANRKNYMMYIEQLNMQKGDVAFFDFVAKGTSQMYMERLVENHLKGLYFLQLEEEYMRDKELDIVSFYKKEERDSSAIFDNYYILETMLTSPMPSVKEFDENGEPCYAQETRKDKDIVCFLKAQEGIFDYFKTYLKICPGSEMKADKKLNELFLMLIHGITILDKNFEELKVEDPFFNRMTDVSDLI